MDVAEVDAPVGDKDGEEEVVSDSGSATPELLVTPAASPTKPALTRLFSSPSRSSSSGLTLAQRSPGHSEDFALFSQSSAKLGVDKNVIENCINTIKVSDSEDDEEVISSTFESVRSSHMAPRSPLVKVQTPLKQVQSSSSIDLTPRHSPLASLSAVTPRRSLRKYQSEDAVSCTPEAAKDENDVDEVSSSQPSPSLKHRQMRLAIPRLDDSLVSPIIGQQKFTAIAKLSPSKSKSSSTLDTKNARLHPSKPFIPLPDPMEDDGGSSPEVESSSEPLISLKDSGENCTSSEPIISELGVRLTAGRREAQPSSKVLESNKENEEKTLTSSEKVTVRRPLKEAPKLMFQGLEFSDSDEDSSTPVVKENFRLPTPNKSDQKKQTDIFSAEGKDICLERRYKKILNAKQFYFRNDSESATATYERVMNKINQYFSVLKEYQSTLTNRLPWGDPIKVDKRVKYSFDAPRPIRRQTEPSHLTSDKENCRMVTRNTQLRVKGTTGEVSSSEESLPDMGAASGGLYDSKRKTANKRKGVQIGSNRKQIKLHHNEEPEDRPKASIKDLDIINESDSEDFELPLLGSRLIRSSPLSKEKMETTPVYTSNARSSERKRYVSKVEENSCNFDLGSVLASSVESEPVAEEEEKEVLPEKNTDVGTSASKVEEFDCQPSTSGFKRSNKQPRKTFRLTVDSSDDSQNGTASCSTSNNGGTSLKTRCSPAIQKTTAHRDVEDQKNSGGVTSKSISLLSRKTESLKTESLAFQNSFEDVTLAESSVKTKKDLSSPVSSTLYSDSSGNKVTKKGKNNIQQIKPAPLRLRKYPGKSKGTSA